MLHDSHPIGYREIIEICRIKSIIPNDNIYIVWEYDRGECLTVIKGVLTNIQR